MNEIIVWILVIFFSLFSISIVVLNLPESIGYPNIALMWVFLLVIIISFAFIKALKWYS
jgi:hypothetical protein